MALFRVSNNRAQFDAAGNEATDQYGAGIRFDVTGDARVTTASATHYNQGIPMSATGQVAIVDATAGLPAGTIFHNGLPISGDKVCVSRNATAVVSNGLPYDAAGAVAGDINFDLNFIGTNTLNSAITFTRASSATFVGSNGLIQSATTNTPRFDYDPVTLAAKGLLIEEQRTNLLTYSEQFDNAAWAKVNSPTLVSNVAVAPDGATTADSIQAVTGGTFQYVSQTATVATNATVTASIYVRKETSETAFGGLGLDFQGGTRRIVYVGVNAVTGVANNLVGGTLTGTVSVFNAGNYWRVNVTATDNGSNTSCSFLYYANLSTDNVNVSGTPAASSAKVIWGAQLEAGSFATSYIPTVASQVTRSADVASVNTLSPWYNADQSTVYIELQSIWTSGTTGGDRQAWSAVGGTDSRLGIVRGSGGSIQFHDETTYRNMPNGTYNDGSIRKVAIGINDPATSANAAINGTNGTVTTDGTTLDSRITSFRIGASTTGSEVWCGWIRRFTYYPRQLSLAECAAITT